VSSWHVARLEDIPVIDDGRVPMRMVRHHLGVEAFGINAWLSREAGEAAINEHDEADSGDEELYVVLSGHAVFTVDGEEVDAPEGTLLLVEPDAKRGAVAKEAHTTILAVGGVPGQAYLPSGWELWSPAYPHFVAGEYDQVIELLEPIAEEHPEYAVPLYNLACAESLLGRTDEALGHLGQAVEADPRFRKHAASDEDFAAIRDDPRFAELVGAD
jgi:tetratricopeptide (TPR) repeat protein